MQVFQITGKPECSFFPFFVLSLVFTSSPFLLLTLFYNASVTIPLNFTLLFHFISPYNISRQIHYVPHLALGIPLNSALTFFQSKAKVVFFHWTQLIAFFQSKAKKVTSLRVPPRDSEENGKMTLWQKEMAGLRGPMKGLQSELCYKSAVSKQILN